jgi:murein DD-endopeptidase MepM/ murein hydrolase activator NlpD
MVNLSSKLQSMIEGVKEIFQGKSKPTSSAPKPKISPITKGYQAPIKANFYNSGPFSPGVATDKRHQHGHNGVDLRAAGGTPAYPIAPGIVTDVGSFGNGGNMVFIQHANDVKSSYAHLGTVSVHKGDRVGYDTVIGTVGDSGNAKGTWPHIHFEVKVSGALQNPANFFSIPPYTNVDQSKEKFWASNEAKEQAQAFNMSQHKASKTAKRIDEICKLADLYHEMTLR